MTARTPLPPALATAPFTTADGLAAGIRASRLRGTDLEHPFHGVIAARPRGHDPRTPRDTTRNAAASARLIDLTMRCAAYMKRMPPNSFFNSVTAARLMQLPLPVDVESDDLLHVAGVAPARSASGRGVVGHKVQLMGGDIRDWAGLPISTPERVWCELGVILPVLDLVALGDHLVHHKLPHTSIAALAEATARYKGRRGKPALLEALDELDDRAGSPQESKLRVILHRGNVTGFFANLRIDVPGFTYFGDLVFPAEKVVLEYQGEYHHDATQWRKDMTRVGRLEAAGWLVMLINADDLKNPAELVQRVRSVLEIRRASPTGT